MPTVSFALPLPEDKLNWHDTLSPFFSRVVPAEHRVPYRGLIATTVPFFAVLLLIEGTEGPTGREGEDNKRIGAKLFEVTVLSLCVMSFFFPSFLLFSSCLRRKGRRLLFLLTWTNNENFSFWNMYVILRKEKY